MRWQPPLRLSRLPTYHRLCLAPAAVPAAPDTPLHIDGMDDAAIHLMMRQPRADGLPSTSPASSSDRQQAAPGVPPTLPRPPRRTTAAPKTVRAAARGPADPRLLLLTRQLLAAKGEAEIADALASQQLLPDEFRRLLTYLGRAGAADAALAAFRCRRALQPELKEDAVLWTKLMKMHSARPGGAAVAIAIYREMRAAGVQADLVAYNVAIAAAGKAQLWKKLAAVREDMLSSGTLPDAFTYSSLLSACQAGGRWQQALDWVEEMEQAGVQPNVVHFTTLMTTLLRAGEWEKAIDAFRKLEAAGVQADAVCYNSAITACAKVRFVFEFERRWGKERNRNPARCIS